jgi:hypothetical protein
LLSIAAYPVSGRLALPDGKRKHTESLAGGGSAILVVVIRSVRKEIRKPGDPNSTPVGLERSADYRSAQTQVKTKRPRQKGEQDGKVEGVKTACAISG